ncbi:MAG TPA: carboxypeptidase-like regulatory domain-containing protein [Pyrinomonadaceae bacterium]
MTKRIIAIIVFALFISGYELALGCSCVETASPCEAYAEASAVFIGSVMRVEPGKALKGEGGEEYEGGQIAYVQIEKSFKGIKATEIVLHQPGHNCAPRFKPGQRWLLYAAFHRDSKTWEVYGCGRSTWIESAGDDLLFLQGLPKSATKTRISGELKHYEEDPEKGFTFINNIIGAKVKIIGAEKTYEVYTDKNGVYEIYGLPPGKYTIEPEIPLGLKVGFSTPFGAGDSTEEDGSSQDKTPKVGLKAQGCAGSDFILQSDSSISGKVFGVNGEVLPNVCLGLKPTDKIANPYFSISDCTEADGSFKLEEIPPGSYVIVVNNDGKISSNEPFPTAYYPGVFDKEKAAVITISEGDRRENYNIQIPSQSLTRVVQGLLLYSDGHPVADEYVSFKAEGKSDRYDWDARAATDDQGRFSLTLLQGAVGSLRAEMYVSARKFSDCPQIRKLIEGKKEGATYVETRAIRIEGDSDIQNVKLMFAFSYCPKRSTDQDK